MGKEGCCMDKPEILKGVENFVEGVPAEKMPEAIELMKEMVVKLAHLVPKMTPEQYQLYLDCVPYDDEELSDEALRRIEEGEKDYREGRCQPWDEVAVELGL